MAAGSSQTSERHEVFLSFRGDDVRKSFIDHLRMALHREGITAFYDDTGLERGEEIQSKLYEAIESSKIAIVTFSLKYADSRWCLDELVKIMERRGSHGLIVLPVFYDVDPTHVRHQSGPYQEPFRAHGEKYGSQRLSKWKQALRSVADLAGFGLQNQANGYEAQFVKHIIKEVVWKLDTRQLDIPRYMVGAESSLVRKITKWLRNGSSQVEVGIIYGPGGVGKTTTAKVVYNENHRRFVCSSFLADVRTAYVKDEFIRLQKQLVSDITGKEEININSVHHGKQKIEKAIRNKAILVVLDDVDEVRQFLGMFVCPDWFFSGSKIMITTRNQYLLINENDMSVRRFKVRRFEACLLDEKNSVQLFSYHAFGQAYPPQDYIKISKPFIKYCGGLPLALAVLASSLRSIRFEMWEQEFARLPENLDENVHNVLNWSFDSIQRSSDKDIFLHIAFFMVGRTKEFALKILDGCGLPGKSGLDNLIGKCLVSVHKDSDTLSMHQLIQQMGYEVVRRESPTDLGHRSRISDKKDAYEVLRKKMGTSKVKGLHLDNHANPSEKVPLHLQPIKTDAFTKMNNLDLLLLENVQLNGGFEDFPKWIKWLLWLGCPLKEIPLDFELDELVVLDMQKSSLLHVWNGLKCVGALKILNLSHSHQLLSTPDLSSALMLEWISCEDCINLMEVHESIGKLENLIYLSLEGCINLVTWHKSMGILKKLTRFSAKGCRNLRNLPMNLLGAVERLDLEGCSSLFMAWNQVESPRSLSISPLPFNIYLPFLKRLNLVNCGICRDDVMELISCAPSLEDLDLSHNPIRIMSNMSRSVCLNLKSLKLRSLKLVGCGISRVEDMGMVSLAPSLEHLDLSHNPIREMNGGPFLKLRSLTLDNCPNLQSISNILERCTLGLMGSHSLKRITYYIINENERHLIEANDFQKHIENEYGASGTAVIERTRKMTEERARYLGFPNLNTFESFDDAGTEPVSYGRGIYQAGMYCVTLLGDHLAEWFRTTITLRRVSDGAHMAEFFHFQAPFSGWTVVRYMIPSFHSEERRIRALNVGFVGFPDVLVMKNVSRMWKWMYRRPRVTHVDKWDELRGGVTWVFHWCVAEHRQIEPGDLLETHVKRCTTMGVELIYEEKIIQLDNDRAKQEDNDNDSAIDVPVWYNNTVPSHSVSCRDFLGVGDDEYVSASAAGSASHIDLSKLMNSSKVSTSDDNEGSATTTSDVAVWYNNAFRSQDLSLYFYKEEVEQEKDEDSSCDATAFRVYCINLREAEDESNYDDESNSDDESFV